VQHVTVQKRKYTGLQCQRSTRFLFLKVTIYYMVHAGMPTLLPTTANPTPHNSHAITLIDFASPSRLHPPQIPLLLPQFLPRFLLHHLNLPLHVLNLLPFLPILSTEGIPLHPQSQNLLILLIIKVPIVISFTSGYNSQHQLHYSMHGKYEIYHQPSVC
jgi:hypothetical protein